jgi:hypothetical protein
MCRYVTGLIDDGRIENLRCPMSDSCGAFVQQMEVSEIAGPAMFKKYRRFRLMHMDPNLRQCPDCLELCSPSKDLEAGTILPAMRCHNCHTEFCFYHSNAHAGRPCGEMSTQIDDDERMELALSMGESTKQCPNCSILTQKKGGCNHMTCRQCGQNWCWVCGDKIDTVSSHYSPENPNGCKQFGSLSEVFGVGEEQETSRGAHCGLCLVFALVLMVYGLADIWNWARKHSWL